MSEHSEDTSTRASDPLAEMLQKAGARPEIDPLRRQRVEREVRRAWQASLRRRRQTHWAMAMAACLAMVAVAIALRNLPVGIPTGDVAVVVHLDGRAYVSEPQGRRTLSVGDRLLAGARVETAQASHLALSIERLSSLRVNENTQLTLVDDRHLELQQGALYLDSGDRSGDVLVTTPLLQASDIGTRFMVRHADDIGSEVGVRDGLVQVKAHEQLELVATERIRISQDGEKQRSHLPAHAADWDWTLQAAVPFAAEGQPLIELLTWYAHESGLHLRLAHNLNLQQRLSAPLQGDVAGLDANELLDVARVAGPVTIRIDHAKGELHVEL